MITIEHTRKGINLSIECRDWSEEQLLYICGDTKPNYPVPAIRGWNIDPPHDGGVQDDFVMIGATFVDWSRGSIEIY